jgi:hypothetical protein
MKIKKHKDYGLGDQAAGRCAVRYAQKKYKDLEAKK